MIRQLLLRFIVSSKQNILEHFWFVIWITIIISQYLALIFCSENTFRFSLSFFEKPFVLKRKSRKKKKLEETEQIILPTLCTFCLNNCRSPMCLLSTSAQESVLRDSCEPPSALCLLFPHITSAFSLYFSVWQIKKQQTPFCTDWFTQDSHYLFSRVLSPYLFSLLRKWLMHRTEHPSSYSGGSW